ncbi:MAG: transposase [Omnitrophica bacterium RIFCSPLOWO2_01_FULL_45_10]|nr:MAG: transposase [Omnitrophica bacterium RIFCSPLOWO2_01_FULL_45_10]
MPRKRYTEEQIIGVLKQAEAGVKTPDICREHGISNATLYKWKAKFGGMEISDARKLRALEDENRRLKHIVADLTLDNQALKAINSKNF